jgi:nucleotide-binding universal stress UspA family protein
LSEHPGCKVRSIELAGLAPKVNLARCIPQEVARRFHLLPVAEARGRVTVAMADPDDAEARKIVGELFGSRAYIVRGDKESIDRLLKDIWPENARLRMRILSCAPWGTMHATFSEYAGQVSELLQAELHWGEFPAKGENLGQLGGAEGENWDLILCSAPALEGRRIGSRLRGLSRMVRERRSTLLLARSPRWPIRRILLLLRCEAADLEALSWVRRFSTPYATGVTALTLIPPVPAMYAGLRRMEVDMGDVLSTNSKLGVHLRTVAARLAHWQIEGHLRIRQGAPEGALLAELDNGEFDLLAAGGQACSPIKRYLIPDLAEMALDLSPLPVLITSNMPEEGQGGPLDR